MASNSNSGSVGWKPNQQGPNNSQYWTSNSVQGKSNIGSNSRGWAFNSEQSKYGFKASSWANTSNVGSERATGWASNTGKGSTSSGDWQNESAQSSSHQDENPINWDGLVDDEFKKEIGQMAKDLKSVQPTWK